jgi:hypothetical protein
MKKISYYISILLCVVVLTSASAVLVYAQESNDHGNEISNPNTTIPSQGSGNDHGNELQQSDATLNGPGAQKSDATLNGNSALPTLKNPLKGVNSITDLLYKMVDILIFIGVIVAVFMFIFIGFKFVWAQGDPKGLAEARSWFMYAVIGTAILISSKVIVEVIKNTLTSAGVVDERIWNKP